MNWIKRLFKKNKQQTVSKLTHDIFPEALHWQIGDTIEDAYTFYHKWSLLQINSDCTFFAQEMYNSRTELKQFKFNRNRFINISYNIRRMKEKLEVSDKQYQQLVNAFQVSLEELNNIKN